jgi:carboxymethylenebutenolidase
MAGKMVRFGAGNTFSGYLAVPEGGVGPGVLVLHAWWGLNDFFKSLCDRLATEGYVVFAPDLYDGRVVSTIENATRLHEEAGDTPRMKDAALEAVRFLTRQQGVRPIGIGAVGFSMGAAYAALLATLRPRTIRAVVLFYGVYPLDFKDSKAAFLGHFAEEDEWEPRKGVEEMQQALRDAGREVTFHFYPGTGHWFIEDNRPDAYHAQAAEQAWERTLSFLAAKLPEQDEPLPVDAADLLDRIDRGWAEIEDALAGHSSEQLSTPGPEGWSAREHLGHITFWERFMLLSEMGDQPATEVAQADEATLNDFDGINAVVADRTRSRSYEDVLADARRQHAEVVAELKRRPFEQLIGPRFPDDPDERPMMLWIAGNTYGHYGEHAKYIRGILAPAADQ